MDALVSRYLEAAELAVSLIEQPSVGAAWDRPSRLAGYPVGGLTAHLARAVQTVATYADAPEPQPGPTIRAAQYFAAVLGDHDPLDSEFHAAVRARSESAAARGHAAVAGDVRTTLRLLRGRTDLDRERRIGVLDGIVMTLGDYLETRLVELAIHSVDLAESVGLDPPPFTDAVWEVVARVVAECGLLRSDPRTIALAIARPERHGPWSAFG